jgi:hypothetical protein
MACNIYCTPLLYDCPKLFQEHEEHRSNEASEGYKVIPLQRLALEEDDGEECKDGDRDNLLNNLELHQRERTAIAHEADAVGWHLTGILKERQEPADEDNDVERGVVRDELHLLQLQVSVPSERHENVRYDKQ